MVTGGNGMTLQSRRTQDRIQKKALTPPMVGILNLIRQSPVYSTRSSKTIETVTWSSPFTRPFTRNTHTSRRECVHHLPAATAPPHETHIRNDHLSYPPRSASQQHKVHTFADQTGLTAEADPGPPLARKPSEDDHPDEIRNMRCGIHQHS
jgi:hypothetical protein